MRGLLHVRIAKQIRRVHCQVPVCVQMHMLVTVTDQRGVSTTQSASGKKIVIKARVVDSLFRDDKLLWHKHECIGTSMIHPDICVAILTRALKSFDTWTGVVLSACHLV
jgi:hypothetical protein